MEWMLSKKLFAYATKLLNIQPTIDLFATRINKQLESYVAYRPDPYALAIDAFTQKWDPNVIYYLFPPFSVIAKCLQKIMLEMSNVVMVVPLWNTQVNGIHCCSSCWCNALS